MMHLKITVFQLEESMKKNERRSERQKKNKRAFSPDCDEEVKKRKRGSKRFSTTSVNRPCDLLPNGKSASL